MPFAAEFRFLKDLWVKGVEEATLPSLELEFYREERPAHHKVNQVSRRRWRFQQARANPTKARQEILVADLTTPPEMEYIMTTRFERTREFLRLYSMGGDPPFRIERRRADEIEAVKNRLHVVMEAASRSCEEAPRATNAKRSQQCVCFLRLTSAMEMSHPNPMVGSYRGSCQPPAFSVFFEMVRADSCPPGSGSRRGRPPSLSRLHLHRSAG